MEAGVKEQAMELRGITTSYVVEPGKEADTTTTTLEHSAPLPLCNVAISGGGIGVTAYSGVFHATHMHWDVRNVMGVSAGAIVGACMLCKLPAETVMASYERVVLPTYAASHDLLLSVKRWVEDMLPEDAHAVCSGRLTVLTTRLAFPGCWRKEYHTHFSSRRHLISVLLASSRVPFVTCRGWGRRLLEPAQAHSFDGMHLPSNIPAHFADGGPGVTLVFNVTAPSLCKLAIPESAERVYARATRHMADAARSQLCERMLHSKWEPQPPTLSVPWLTVLWRED